LPGPTGRFDGFVPLMFHPLAPPAILSPFRPFATVACKYERSFIRTESNSPNNVFLPLRPGARSTRRRFSSVRECTAIPLLEAVDCGKREAAGWTKKGTRREKRARGRQVPRQSTSIASRHRSSYFTRCRKRCLLRAANGRNDGS